jgi:hypothetical protein
MLSHTTLNDVQSVSFDAPEGDDPECAEFQVVVTRHHSRSNLSRRVQTTDTAPRSSRGPAPPSDWFETIVSNAYHSGSRSHSGVRPAARAEITLSGGSSIRRDIMEQAVRPIKVGKFVFSRQKVNCPA